MPRGAGRGKLPRTAQSLPRGTAQGCCVKRGEGSLFLIAISPPQRPRPRGAASHPYRQRVALSVRVERRGKSSPIGWRLSDAVNSIRSNTGMGAGGPTPKAGPAAPGVAGAYRRRYVEIDDCLIQNPAYSLARTRRGPGESQGLFLYRLMPVLPRGVLVDAAEDPLPAVKGQMLAPRLRAEGDPTRRSQRGGAGDSIGSTSHSPSHGAHICSKISSGRVSGHDSTISPST